MTIAVVSRNLIYRMGGAEISLQEELRRLPGKHHSLVYLPQPCYKNEIDYGDMNVSFCPVDGIKPWGHSFDIEYFAQHKEVAKHIDRIEAVEVITQGKWAPVAVEYADKRQIPSTYYVRDESSLNIRKNYKLGLRRIAKHVHGAIEYPFRKYYEEKNATALRRASRIICNSYFMSGVLRDKFGLESEVVYPYVDEDKLRADYQQALQAVSSRSRTKKTVVLIGDSEVKGIHLFLQLAQAMQQYDFVVYSHKVSAAQRRDNLVFRPWCSTSAAAFAEADLVLMPSVWDEAFGRVAVEAKVLGIPCVVANRGGLPEAVDHDSSFIASDFKDYKIKISDILG